MSTLYTDEYVEKMHYRQAEILRNVALEDRDAVVDHAHFRMNISGGNFSSNLHLAVDSLRRFGSAAALREDTRSTNAKLMGWS